MNEPLGKLIGFDALYARAVKLKGSTATLEALLPEVMTARQLARISDDRWLSGMTKRIFQSGFNWGLIEKKWPAFETAFNGFDPARWANASDEDLDPLLKDTTIVRNGAKIWSVRSNAIFVQDLAREHGSAANAFANWPSEDYAGLLHLVHKRGSRLGGATAQYFFRGMGKDSFLLSQDVITALIREGVVDKPPTSKRAMEAVQAAFNHWHGQSDRPLAHLSRILAATVDSTGRHVAGNTPL
ncbi:MAG: DNA-3-methyladenine glycosylase I [Alphaproteobacteria bacterium]